MIKRALQSMHVEAARANRANIVSLLDRNEHARLLDLGCDDGAWTCELGKAVGTSAMFGVEIVAERAAEARTRGINVIEADLAQRLPLDSGYFDVIHANQVIEHVPSVDVFMSEIARLLRPGGCAIISTENGSSWHNIGATVLGWQMFSLTNVSARIAGIGNPLALHRSESIALSSWTHKTIFNYRGLVEFVEAHGLRETRCLGAGYYPLPASVGRIDPRHAHFLALRAFKRA